MNSDAVTEDHEMADHWVSNEVARPIRKSKRRGKQPDKLRAQLFLLPYRDVDRVNKDMCSKAEIERLKREGLGPPPDSKTLLT